MTRLPSSALQKLLDEKSTHGHYAGFVSRAVGLIIDVLLVVTFVVLTDWLTVQTMQMIGMNVYTCTSWQDITSFTSFVRDICYIGRISLYVFSFVALPVYLFVLWWLSGQTIGMEIAGIRAIRINGERLRAHNAFRRLLGYVLCILTLGLGFAWSLLDNRRQGWHDKLARTVVVYWRPDERRVLLARLRQSQPGSPARRSGIPAIDPQPAQPPVASPAQGAASPAPAPTSGPGSGQSFEI